MKYGPEADCILDGPDEGGCLHGNRIALQRTGKIFESESEAQESHARSLINQ